MKLKPTCLLLYLLGGIAFAGMIWWLDALADVEKQLKLAPGCLRIAYPAVPLAIFGAASLQLVNASAPGLSGLRKFQRVALYTLCSIMWTVGSCFIVIPIAMILFNVIAGLTS